MATSAAASSKAAQETPPTSSSQPWATTSAASSPGSENSGISSCSPYGARSSVKSRSIWLLNGRLTHLWAMTTPLQGPPFPRPLSWLCSLTVYPIRAEHAFRTKFGPDYAVHLLPAEGQRSRSSTSMNYVLVIGDKKHFIGRGA